MQHQTSEQYAETQFLKHIDKAIEAGLPIAHWGDGFGGYLKELFQQRLDDHMKRGTRNEHR